MERDIGSTVCPDDTPLPNLGSQSGKLSQNDPSADRPEACSAIYSGDLGGEKAMTGMSWLAEFVEEWKARRAGRRHVSNDIYRRARDITGATGWVTSRAWDHADRDGQAYSNSLDERRVPPSLHISARDQIRAGKAMPLAERCIEDYHRPAEELPGDWSTSELDRSE